MAGVWVVRLYGSHLRRNVCEPALGAPGSHPGGPSGRSRAQRDLWNSSFSCILEGMGSTEDLEIRGAKTESG